MRMLPGCRCFTRPHALSLSLLLKRMKVRQFYRFTSHDFTADPRPFFPGLTHHAQPPKIMCRRPILSSLSPLHASRATSLNHASRTTRSHPFTTARSPRIHRRRSSSTLALSFALQSHCGPPPKLRRAAPSLSTYRAILAKERGKITGPADTRRHELTGEGPRLPAPTFGSRVARASSGKRATPLAPLQGELRRRILRWHEITVTGKGRAYPHRPSRKG
jgi:hypothetical protein